MLVISILLWNFNIQTVLFIILVLILTYNNSLSDIILSDSYSNTFLLLNVMVYTLCSNLLNSNMQNNSMLALLIICSVFFSCNNLYLLFFSFELVLLPIVITIIIWGYQNERLQASTFLIIFTITFSLPSFYILYLLIIQSNSAQLFINLYFTINSFIIWVVILPFIVNFPVFIFHSWLPKAHVEAPTYGSIFLAGILLKLGVYGIIRVLILLKLHVISQYIFALNLLCCASMLSACVQNDSNILIAYNSVGHITLLFIVISLAFQNSNDCANIISYTHGITASMLFHFVGDFYQNINSRVLFYSSSLATLNLVNLFCLFSFCVSNLGVPPSLQSIPEIIIVSLWFSNFHFLLLLVFMFLIINLWTTVRFIINTLNNNENLAPSFYMEENNISVVICSINLLSLIIYF